MGWSAFFHRHLPRVWLHRGPFACALLPVSVVYGALISLRRVAFATGLFKSQRVPALVIVVGNVVAGGAGKTPVTIAMVRHLKAQGFQVGVVSRGHGRHTQGTLAVAHNSRPLEVGDEPLLIHQATGVPVWVAKSRADAALGLLQANPQVQILICDDGLQHLALTRDIEICVMDERGVGNGWLLPAGPLREAWPRPIDGVLHTGPSISGERPDGEYGAPRQLADHALTSQGQRVALSSLSHRPVHAVAGLARPESFFDRLRQAGLQLASTTALPDHHDYTDWSAGADRTWLCTEKDAAKLWTHEPNALAVPLVITPDPAFWAALDQRIRHLLAHPNSQTKPR